MDIERLKELKAELEKVRKYNDMHCMSTVTEDDVLELIDEAITNQPVTKSATSEEVAEAIKHFNRVIAQLKYLDGGKDGPYLKYYIRVRNAKNRRRLQASRLAIAALQAYQPTIYKTETTSCEWCDSGIDTASVMSADMMMRFVRPVNYCPNCGRRLKEKRHDISV